MLINNPFSSIIRPNIHPAFFFKVKLLDEAPGTLSKSTSAIGKTLPGILLGESFQEVSGISMELQTEEIKSGGENDVVYKVPSKIQYPNLILKRALVAPNSDLLKWCIATIQGGLFDIKPKNILITLMNPTTSLATTEWKIIGAYPLKYEVGQLNAERNEIVLETVELSYQKFELMPVTASNLTNTSVKVATNAQSASSMANRVAGAKNTKPKL